jgi:hypothetical protein
VTVVHGDLGVVGVIKNYWPPGTFRPPVDQDEAKAHLVASREPVNAWCVELGTGDVVLWRANALTPLGPHELSLLGGVAAGTESLFKAVFERAKVLGVPLPKALELVLIAFRSQCAALARHLPQRDAPAHMFQAEHPSAPSPPPAPPADEPSSSGAPSE